MSLKRRARYCIILIFMFFQGLNMAFAQEIVFSPRDNIIFATLNQLQARQNAIGEAMKEAQLIQLESKVRSKAIEAIETKKGSSVFSDFIDRLHPYLISVVDFNDNTYNKTKQYDIDSRVAHVDTVGAKINFLNQGRSLNLDMYLKNKHNPHGALHNNIQEITFDALSNLPLGRYNLSISEEAVDHRVFREKYDGGDGSLLNYWSNDFASKLSRNFNRIAFDAGYERMDYFYGPDFTVNNWVEETYTANTYLRIGSKTMLKGGYKYYDKQYTHSFYPAKDSNYHDFSLLLTGILSPKLTGSMGAEYQLADNIDADRVIKRDLNWKIGYMASERTNFALSLEHILYKSSIAANCYIEDTFNLEGNHRLAFNPKLQLSLSYAGDYKDDYKKDIPGQNITYTWGSGLTYAFRQWLDFSLDYNFRTLHSEDGYSYKNNLVVFKTEARF